MQACIGEFAQYETMINKFGETKMNKLFRLLPVAAALSLAACGGNTSGSDKASSSGRNACGNLAADEVCVSIGSAAPKTGGISIWAKTLKTV